MVSLSRLLTCLCLGLYSSCIAAADVPRGFVELRHIAPSIVQDIRYASPYNFTGHPIAGYFAAKCLLSLPAANALAQAQNELLKFGLSLKVYDCYRPQQAVNDFIAWSQDPHADQMRHEFFPRIPKTELFHQGYIAAQSSHSRGSTVDLTIVTLPNLKALPMGTPYDFLDPLSHPDSLSVPPFARAHRFLLKSLMQQQGFAPLATEWWHFTLANEPYPNTYFNFPIR